MYVMIKELSVRLKSVVRGSVLSLVFIGGLVTASSAVHANTFVRVSTSYGDLTLELFDDVAPITVQNFLNYVNRGDYNGTFFGRSIPGFVLQGGSYYFDQGPKLIETDPPIVNEFSVSNTRGTIAMAKLAGDPDSAKSAFFINLVDNSATLDVDNGGYTVFGQVLGDGMNVVDAIAALPTFAPGSAFPNLPLRNYTDPSANTLILANNFVTINTEVVQRHSAAISVFESQSGLLMTTIDGGEGVGLLSLNLSLLTDRDGIVFKLNEDSVVSLQHVPDGSASFSLDDYRLRIPTLELNINGSVTLATDVVLLVSDADNLEFTLESFQQ